MTLHRDEIKRPDWPAFMDRFSRLHRGWRVRLGVIDTGLLACSTEAGAREIGADALFEGLRLDQRADGDHIAVLLGLPSSLASHSIHEARRVFVERTEDGGDEALRVDAADGRTVVLQFEATARPDELDGIAPGELPGSGDRPPYT